MRRILPVLAAFYLAPAASAAPTPNACALLTNTEVAKVLAGKVAFHVAQSLGNGTSSGVMCTWYGPPMGYSQTRSRLVLLESSTTKARFLKTANETDGAVRVRGLGDVAFATSRELEVWNGGLAIGFLGLEPGMLPKVERLAAAAVRRL